uniref:Uncharacterized protein n=1 Tax=Strigamia maritima TaxID=126957 RepID=T1ITC3_STRMM
MNPLFWLGKTKPRQTLTNACNTNVMKILLQMFKGGFTPPKTVNKLARTSISVFLPLLLIGKFVQFGLASIWIQSVYYSRYEVVSCDLIFRSFAFSHEKRPSINSAMRAIGAGSNKKVSASPSFKFSRKASSSYSLKLEPPKTSFWCCLSFGISYTRIAILHQETLKSLKFFPISCRDFDSYMNCDKRRSEEQKEAIVHAQFSFANPRATMHVHDAGNPSARAGRTPGTCYRHISTFLDLYLLKTAFFKRLPQHMKIDLKQAQLI